MGTKIRVTTYDWEIGRLFLPGPGENAWDWMRRAGNEQMWHTKRLAPYRTGDLQRSLNLSLTPYGPLNVRYTIGSYSDYAEYVIKGTGPQIWGNGNWVDMDDEPVMRIRAAPHSWFTYPVNMYIVDGQMPNDFLSYAANFIIAKYG